MKQLIENSSRESCKEGEGKCNTEADKIAQAEDEGLIDVTVATVIFGTTLLLIAILSAIYVGYQLIKHKRTVNEKKLYSLELQRQIDEKDLERKTTLLKKNKNNLTSDD